MNGTETPARRLIRAQGRQVKWVAERIGVERSYFNRMVLGQRPMPRDVAERVAQVLGVPVEVIQVGREQVPV